MKIVLWAYHEAGYRALRKLHAAGHELLVFTEQAPPYVPSVFELAGALNHRVRVGISDRQMADLVRSFTPDLGLSMYCPKIINKTVLNLPRLGAFNFHPALLPKHRGCFSAPWAILEGDSVTGVTCHAMIEKVDAGGILCQSSIDIAEADTAFSLYYKLVDTALLVLDEAMELLGRGPLRLKQQASGGCYHRRELPYHGYIDPAWPIETVARFIRAMYFPPHPPARLLHAGKEFSVTSLEQYRQLMGPGT